MTLPNRPGALEAARHRATPAEPVASGGGDCENYTISKCYLLKEIGVPLDRMRIAYVKATKINEAHMVLACFPQPNAEPLILDNLDNRVRPAGERADVVAVYSFKDDEVVLVQGSVKGKPSQIRAWLYLQQRLIEPFPKARTPRSGAFRAGR